jgi:CheY-like chemotaxis protein
MFNRGQDCARILGYRILDIASIGTAALQISQAHPSDLILVDITLTEELDGIEQLLVSNSARIDGIKTDPETRVSVTYRFHERGREALLNLIYLVRP